MNTPENPPGLVPWIRKSARTIAKTRIFVLEEVHWHCPTEPDRSGDFAVLDSPDWANVIALTSDGCIVLVEQFRFGVGLPSLEIPGGIVDPGENPAQTAARELREETGYEGAKPVYIGALSANAAILNNRVHTFVIRDARPVSVQNLDQHEQIRVSAVPIDQIPELISSGRIHHSVIVAAWGLFQIWMKGQNDGAE